MISKIYRSFLAPKDPSLLGYIRIVYGLLMIFDLMIERGMPYMDKRWADDNDNCRFPLIHDMKPMSYNYMASLHGIMAISIIMVTIGFLTKFFNLIFMCGYWYIFILGKDTWNNHSYLFGLFSFMLLNSNANHYMSVDGWLWPKKYKNKHVPSIQYSVIRLQIFILYFYAGIKKYDPDWLDGYSMGKMSRYWVFDPIKSAGEMAGISRDTTTHLIDLFMVHLGGFLIDFLGGFMLYCDKTRYLAFVIMASFHGLNSQLFSIGVFSYTCLATMFIFCYEDSFRKLLRDKSPAVPAYDLCIYDDVKVEDEPEESKKSGKEEKSKKAVKSKPQRISLVNFLKVSVVLLYMGVQLFLPFSHFITLGYNGWTQGTYGYSWDMMIHSFSTQHIKIRFVNPITGEDGYLKPDAFTSGRASSRWTQHADQLWQYAHCLKDKLITLEVGTEEQPPEIYFDVWKTMNKRFNQRVYKSDMNILETDWKWNQHPKFTLPLLSGYNDWRPRIREMGKNMMNQSEYTEVTFIADFPGMFLENFLNSDLGNTTIEVLDGHIEIELLDEEDQPRTPLKIGERLALPADQFHNVHVTGENPACYMYIYENTTHKEFVEGMRKFEMKIEELKITNMTTYEPEEGEEKFHKLMLERQQKIEEYARENGIELKHTATTDAPADGASDTGDSTDKATETPTDSPTDSSENRADDAAADDTSKQSGDAPSDTAADDTSDQSNDAAKTEKEPEKVQTVDDVKKEVKKKPMSVEEGFATDRWMRVIERKAWLFKRSYRLAKFALGAVLLNWRPDFEEHMRLDEPNFIVPDHWFRNTDYGKSRVRRREKYQEYVQEQLKMIIETYEYDEEGNLVPKEKPADAESDEPDDGEPDVPSAHVVPVDADTADTEPKTEL